MRRSEIFTRPLSDVLLEADHDDLELEPDPYSQANLDRWVRKKSPVFDPTIADPAVDRMREAWKRNALLDEGGDALFETRAGVGDHETNGRVDVAKIETLLAALGAFDLNSLDGPTGFFAANKGDDRGREGLSPSPPSEPHVRFSRIRLSSRWFPHRGCLAACHAG